MYRNKVSKSVGKYKNNIVIAVGKNLQNWKFGVIFPIAVDSFLNGNIPINLMRIFFRSQFKDSLKLIVSPNLYKIRCWLTELQLDSDRTQGFLFSKPKIHSSKFTTTREYTNIRSQKTVMIVFIRYFLGVLNLF